MTAKFFLQMMILLCVGLTVSTKALAKVLLTWGSSEGLKSLCIEGCSCAGSASVVEMKMYIHK